jgi:hypothetical protein
VGVGDHIVISLPLCNKKTSKSNNSLTFMRAKLGAIAIPIHFRFELGHFDVVGTSGK